LGGGEAFAFREKRKTTKESQEQKKDGGDASPIHGKDRKHGCQKKGVKKNWGPLGGQKQDTGKCFGAQKGQGVDEREDK